MAQGTRGVDVQSRIANEGIEAFDGGNGPDSGDRASTPPARSSSNSLPGFTQRPVPTREELLGQGVSQNQADRIQFQQHREEVLSQNFARWLMVFSLLLCVMLPTMLGLFLWLVVSYALESNKDCDVPLRMWVVTVCANVAYHTNMCGVGSMHQVILKVCCRHDPQEGRAMPWYVKIYNLMAIVLIFTWHCVGLHWVRISETCEETSPALYDSVRVFASFSVVFNIVVYINTVGLYAIMMFMLRNGMLRSTDNAAPEGTLLQQSVVKFDPVLFKDNMECCICIADFDASTEIRRTRCGHCFHGKCLQGWLKVNRTCPLCRSDLVGEASDAQVVAPAPEVHGNAADDEPCPV
jgi:hypothetical protein